MASRTLTIGIVYETFDTYPRTPDAPADADAEYEPESTIVLLEAAILRLGHRTLRLGSPHQLLARLATGDRLEVDAALNIAEGYGSRNREAWAPVLLEMAGIPMLGSDAATLSLSLDKAWANRAVSAAGITVAPQCVLASREEALRVDLDALGLTFPLFVKPRWEGSAKGIRATSRVDDRDGLVREVERIALAYAEPALVETFLPGAEFTVALVGNAPPRVLPILQRALDAQTGIGAHALERPAASGRALVLPGELTDELETALRGLARAVWDALECRDFARVDFRLDAAGQPVFLEINPLPTFAVDGTFAILAEIAGTPLPDFLAEILAAGLQRLGLDSSAPAGERPAERSSCRPLRGLRRVRVPKDVDPADWESWTWQMRNRVRSATDLARYVQPREAEVHAIEALAEQFHFVITPYYASLMDPDDPNCPLRRQVVPSRAELADPAGLEDPLDEVRHSPVKNVIRVYPDRIAFCVNNECALYCRFCLRKRMVGDVGWTMQKRELATALKWIAETPEIRDVLLTGGDPLTYADGRLEWLLKELRAIPHVDIIRLGTRLPVTLPYRVTEELCSMLARYHPIWVNTHFNHPAELTDAAALACDRLLRAGIPVGNQTVLMAGINDRVSVMQELNETLVRMRVRPYYCYQPQLLAGTAHFRVPIERGIELFRQLRGRTSGFAIPQFVLDTPYGKVPLDHPWARGRDGDDFIVETWTGDVWREPNPLSDSEGS